ncbi:MAG TPA: TolC family protein [Chitinophagaceae bacterium]
MFKLLLLIFFLAVASFPVAAQRMLSSEDAVQLALGNARNINVASLSLKQQQQLLKGAAGLASPQITLEKSPYEPLIVGFQQQLEWPTAYRSRKQLQKAKVELAQGSMKLNELDVKRLARTAYLQLQYLNERIIQLQYQDSIYKDIKAAATRNFQAGQINKLDELFAASQADRISNELARGRADLQQQVRILQLVTGIREEITTERIRAWEIPASLDSFQRSPRLQVLQQQVEVSQRELKAEKASLLPSINGGLLFPTDNTYSNFIGYQVGLYIPLWRGQNKSRIAAANTGIELARANLQNTSLNLENQLLVNQVNLQKEQASLTYFNNIALQQSDQIIETSRRLFDAGEIGYIESLRNITSAFETRINYLETLRNYNQAIIELNYLTGNL